MGDSASRKSWFARNKMPDRPRRESADRPRCARRRCDLAAHVLVVIDLVAFGSTRRTCSGRSASTDFVREPSLARASPVRMSCNSTRAPLPRGCGRWLFSAAVARIAADDGIHPGHQDAMGSSMSASATRISSSLRTGHEQRRSVSRSAHNSTTALRPRLALSRTLEFELVQQGRVAFHALTAGTTSSVTVARSQESPFAVPFRPFLEGQHRHPARPGRKTDRLAAARSLRHHDHALGREPVGVREVQVGHRCKPMWCCHCPRRWMTTPRNAAGHDLELARIDERAISGRCGSALRLSGAAPRTPTGAAARRDSFAAASSCTATSCAARLPAFRACA